MELAECQNREEWLKWRHNGVGASDIPIILGKSKYKTRSRLLMEKLEDTPENKENFITKLGHRVEPKIRGFLNLIHKRNMQPQFCYMKEHHWAKASLDGIWGATPWECKFIGKEIYNSIVEDKKNIPEEFIYQVNWQMLVTNTMQVEFCFVNLEEISFKKPVKRFHSVIVEGSMPLQFDVLFPAAQAFWNEVQIKKQAIKESKEIPLSETH